jgi:hypothetical protein
MMEVRQYHRKKILKKCEDPLTANDMDQDHSGTMSKIILFFSFQLMKITLIILMTTYFLGIVFYIYCDITSESYKMNDDYAINTFIGYHDMNMQKPLYTSIELTYYAFTTLSTVGFGDLTPKSDKERVFTTLILLCGVAVFTIVKDTLMTIFSQI